MLSAEAKGYLYLGAMALSAVIAYLSTGLVFQASPELNPAMAAFFGYAGAVALTTPFFLSHHETRQKIRSTVSRHGWILLSVSILTGFSGWGWFTAMSLADPGPLGFLSQSRLIFTFLLGILLLNERFNWREILGFGTAIAGFTSMSAFDGEVDLLAAILILGFALAQSIQSFVIKKYAPGVEGLAFAYLRGIIVALVIGFIALGQGALEFPPVFILVLLTIGQAFGLIIGRAFYFSAHNLLPISKISFFTLLNPILILLGSALLLGENLTQQKIIGGALVIGGLAIFLHEQFRLKKNTKIS